MEGSNIQQISGIKSIDHAAERPRTGFKRVVQSIMLNYVWTDADLVAFMMLYIARQTRVSHKQKIKVSYVPLDTKIFKKQRRRSGVVTAASVIL